MSLRRVPKLLSNLLSNLLSIFLSVLLSIAAVLAAGTISAAEFEFVDTTVEAGLTGFVQAPGQGSGAAVADFDGDGAPDIFLPTAEGTPNLLFRNRGDGTFDEVAAQVGLADLRQGRVALWVDFDGDGDLDLFVGRDCHIGSADCTARVLSLFEQRDGVFVEVSDAVGLNVAAGAFPFQMHAGGLSAGDVSGDGLPDIFFARWQSRAELLVSDTLALRGDAAGYTYASNATGIGAQQLGHWQGLFHDFNGDSLLDLFVNIDFTVNQLWINSGGMVFDDQAVAAGVDTAWNEMGIAAGDYDNDGDIDIYATNIHGWMDQPARGNRLYRNDTQDGVVAFVDVAEDAGVDDTDWGWGAAWLDADNDGRLDLAVTNGYCQSGYCGEEHLYDRSRFFHQDSAGAGFAEIGQAVGFDDTLIGGTLLAVDFDRDGRMDLLLTAADDQGVGQLRLLMNRPGDGVETRPWLIVQPRTAGPDSHALGAVVRVILDDGSRLTRLITAGTSWMGQGPAEAHFGLGAGRTVRRVVVEWPGTDAVSTWGGLSEGQVHRLCCESLLFLDSFE